MGYYGYEWASTVVHRWADSDPRVMTMLDRFISWAAEEKVPNPADYIFHKMIYLVQRSKGRKEWGIVKAAAGSKITWRTVYMEYFGPRTRLTKDDI